MEAITRFIENNFGLSFLIAVLFVAAVLSGIVWLTIWCIKVISKNKELDKKIADLPCSDHKESIGKHAGKLDDIAASLGKIQGQVELLVKLSTASPTKPLLYATSDYSEKHSPRKLNENGEDLYMKVKGKSFLDENETFLLEEIAKLNPKTALDVENFSLAVLRGNSDKDIFNPLKNWVYTAPIQTIKKADGSTMQKDVSLDDVLFVLSIPLRDTYLEKHPELKIV